MMHAGSWRTGIILLVAMVALTLAPLAAHAGQPTDFVDFQCGGAWTSAVARETTCEYKHRYGSYAYANGSAVATSPGLFVWVTKKGSNTILASCMTTQLYAYSGCSGDAAVNVPYGTTMVCHIIGNGSGTYGCGDVLTR